MGILPGITSLKQYVNLLATKPVQLRLERCLNCGKAHPWLHGSYPRQADRENPSATSLNPVPIQRYYCQTCEKTCSVLPECLPPRRWYPWHSEQMAFLLCLLGSSFSEAAKELLPSRQTISRWYQRFNEQFKCHSDTLRNYFFSLGRASGLADFWQAVFNIMNLGKAMRLCHEAGVFIP